MVSDPQNSARFITEIPNPLALDFRRESAPGEAADVRYGVTIPGQPPITGMLNISACTFKASWRGPTARRQNRPYDLTLNWPGGTDGSAQGDLTVEPADNVPRDIVTYGLTASSGP